MYSLALKNSSIGNSPLSGKGFPARTQIVSISDPKQNETTSDLGFAGFSIDIGDARMQNGLSNLGERGNRNF